ncbi:MAG: sodium-translocating pyrophosphatase, partial [Candidatus Aenigmatarchaeota archaeon]
MEFFPPLAGVVALLFALALAFRIKGTELKDKKVEEISGHIKSGALAYLNKQYRYLLIFVAAVTVILVLVINYQTALAFIVGAFFSALTGNVGMRIATIANARAAEKCEKSLNDGLQVAFSSGSVMGMSVVGIGLIGVSVLFFIFGDPEIIYGFGFGASSIALFARVGGGIYTKAADVGADLVGKVEKGIPEDDPRNPATISDNVGDNVGDVAGMGADLFESYVDSIIAAMAIGVLITAFANAVMLPMLLAGLGIIVSIIGTLFVRTGEGKNPQGALNRGVFAAAGIMFVLSYFLVVYVTGEVMVWYAAVAGLVSGIIIGLTTEYYTSESKSPAISIANASQTGPATNIIAGLSVGLKSTLIPVLVVSATIILSYQFAGLYGIAIAAVGLLSTLGITLATDTYGPVADNAAGIAEMADLGKTVRERAESLDAVGNTTAAIGKGFAIGSAALTALALFAVYGQVVNLTAISLMNPSVVAGLFIGALLPFLFTSFTMNAVGNAAQKMVQEVRRQFRTIKGIMSGKGKPDYRRCIEISTVAALHQMIVPSLLAVLSPIVVGLVLGAEALGGMLAGSI